MFKRLAILLLALTSFAGAQHISGGSKGASLPAPGSSGLCLVSTGASTYNWGSCAGSSSTNWSAIVPGTGTITAGTYNVGTGSSLTITGSGTINANRFNGNAQVAIADGGTGATTAANAINALLPSQTGNSGKFLTTNGSAASWGTPAGSGNTTSTTLTTNRLSKANGANSIIDSLLSDDGTTATYTGTGGFSASKYAATGANGGFDGTEGTGAGLTAATSHDLLWPDSTAHRWKFNPNNAGAFSIPGVATAGSSGNCVKFAANGIDLVDSGAVCGGGGSSTNIQPAIGWLHETFVIHQLAGIGTIVGSGWHIGGTGTPTVSVNFEDSLPTAFGSARMTTSGTSGDTSAVELDYGGSGGMLVNLSSSSGWDSAWRFKLVQTTSSGFAAGFLAFQSSAIPGSSDQGAYLRYDTAAGDSTFKFCTGNGSATNCIDSTIAADTNWHTVRIRSDASGTLIFTLYDAAGTVQKADTSATIDLPSAALSPIAVVATRTGSGASASVSTFDFRVTQ